MNGTEWMPRGFCGPWPPWLIVWYVSANVGIATAYFILPFALLRGRIRGINIGTKTQTVLWAAFIFFCGSGHLLENIGAFWIPNYYVFAAWHTATAVISLYTAMTFPVAAKIIITELNQLRCYKS